MLLLQKIKVTVIDESLKVLSEFDSSVSFDDLQKYKWGNKINIMHAGGVV